MWQIDKDEPLLISDLWASLFLEEAKRLGVKTLCMGAGFRAFPLIKAAENSDLDIVIHYDERSIGFHAMGIAKAKRNPVIVMTTSGTAAANLLPAIVEAHYQHIPLIALTSDCPPEMQDCAASQSIRQADLYQGFTRYRREVPTPSLDLSAEYLLTIMNEAVNYSSGQPVAGPVHLNMAFREPFFPTENPSVPSAKALSDTQLNAYTKGIDAWMRSDQAWKTVNTTTEVLALPDSLESILRDSKSKKGLVCLAAVDQVNDPRLWNFIQALGWPVLVDPQSAYAAVDAVPILPSVDRYLAQIQSEDIPELAIVIGTRFVSKYMNPFLSKIPAVYQLSTQRAFLDPSFASRHHLFGGLPSFLDAALPLVSTSLTENSWAKDCYQRWALDAEEWRAQVRDDDNALELQCYEALSGLDSVDTHIVVANSLSVRLLSAIFSRNVDVSSAESVEATRTQVWTQRGTNGIDGVMSAAFGVARAVDAALTLIIGDMSLAFDNNALSFLSTIEKPVSIIVFNNGGGEIFSILNINKKVRDFDRHFKADPKLSMKDLAATYGIAYQSAKHRDEFVDVYTRRPEAHRIIEVFTKDTAEQYMNFLKKQPSFVGAPA